MQAERECHRDTFKSVACSSFNNSIAEFQSFAICLNFKERESYFYVLIVISSASLVSSNEAGHLLHQKHTQKMFIQYGLLLFTLYVEFVCSPEIFQGAVHSVQRFLY